MKYAIVGTGARHQMFRRAITETYGGQNELVGLCDTNDRRLALSASAIPDQSGNGIATYKAPQFRQMLDEQKPDAVVVTVPDYLHHEYIVAAMRAGCDVMTEKPMTTDLGRLKAILDAQKETGRSVIVTFNYRYTPARTQIKEMLQSGAIGTIAAVDFSWHLDRVHGADYFRRWHRYKDKSGGLLVHKSTHHFDLVNWWLDSSPKAVSANGQRAFYRPETAAHLGLEDRGPRCHDCPAAERCDFRLDLAADEALREIYLEAEDIDGYFRDRCVFDDDITIEDTMQVQVGYESGAMLNYTLCAYSPWEGLEVRFHGTKGELVHRHVEVHGVFGGKRERPVEDAMTTVLHVAGESPRKIEVWTGEGDHGGADPVMLGYLFSPDEMEEDRYGRGSTHVDGAWSILTGIAANASMASGETTHVARMLGENGIELPRR
ncbi:Gfo/Idh/MocA family protein [Chelativorans salis]|uniref:Gfo/Idh/MocA family oxidoreductase n=1 Tax=Chelativorans salis TaxID=2978478 RepID=A0ABT2LPB9_9HYPH|nr:Gfo/Idh/MocA family oxidoreductase [Chelativorans sp. EGI FJ00035]MCT7376402.1 Gfo/Idh/MocA family oxidoreductase [Chelativorans sp. EGI FJ00035]